MQCLNEDCQKPLNHEHILAVQFVECECGTKHALTEQGLTFVDDEMPPSEYLGG